MTNSVPMPLDTHDPDVERAMKIVGQLPPADRDEFIRTVYRYVHAYRRTGDPNLLVELVNGVLASVALRESVHYGRIMDEFRAVKDCAAGGPVDVRRLVAEERERRAG